MSRQAGAFTPTAKLLRASADGVRHQQARADKRGAGLAAMVDAVGFTGPAGCQEWTRYGGDASMVVLMAKIVSDGGFG